MRRARRSILQSAVIAIVSLGLIVPTASADGRPWQSFVDNGLGFLRKYHEPGACSGRAGEILDALASVSPNALGAAVGFAVGAAAGAAVTRSVTGALRAGLLGGSVGSAVGHVAARSGAAQKLEQLTRGYKELIVERDRALCEVLADNERERAPLLHAFGEQIASECSIEVAEVESLKIDAGFALQQCVRDNTVARRIADKHAALMRKLNQATCREAAGIAEAYNRKLRERAAREPDAYTPEPLSADCAEPGERTASVWASTARRTATGLEQ